MIQLAIERMGGDPSAVETRVRAIHPTLLAVYAKAEAEGTTPGDAADRMVEDKLRALQSHLIGPAQWTSLAS